MESMSPNTSTQRSQVSFDVIGGGSLGRDGQYLLRSLLTFFSESIPLCGDLEIEFNGGGMIPSLGKTGGYEIHSSRIVVYTSGRHVKDVLRSLAHELVHHSQFCQDRLNSISSPLVTEDEETGKLEEEAYLTGNMLFRKWEEQVKKERPEMAKLTESKKNAIKMILTEAAKKNPALLDPKNKKKLMKYLEERYVMGGMVGVGVGGGLEEAGFGRMKEPPRLVGDKGYAELHADDPEYQKNVRAKRVTDPATLAKIAQEMKAKEAAKMGAGGTGPVAVGRDEKLKLSAELTRQMREKEAKLEQERQELAELQAELDALEEEESGGGGALEEDTSAAGGAVEGGSVDLGDQPQLHENFEELNNWKYVRTGEVLMENLLADIKKKVDAKKRLLED